MDASNPASAPSKTYAIAPHGDITLVVGEKETQVRVHSGCLRTASKVFDAMLGPHFSEGQPSKGVISKDIPMPDDDATAMTIICNVIHHRYDLLPDYLEPSDLAEMALAADKYDCVLVLKYVMIQWLDFKEPVGFLELGSLLITAYVSDNSDAFRRVTQNLITGTYHSYHSLMDIKYGDVIPSSIFYSLERARTRTRVSVQDVLLAEMACCCDPASRGAYARMQKLLDNNLWGASLFDMSIDSVIEKAAKMMHPTPFQYIYEEQQTMQTRYSKLKELRESAGLCLSCVRSGNIDAKYPCYLVH